MLGRLRTSLPPSTAGALAAGSGVALLFAREIGWSALGVELVAFAFWTWSRAAADRGEQVPRWAWLRRPAAALWLAAGLALVLPPVPAPAVATGPWPVLVAPTLPGARDPFAVLRALQAFAVLWAGLELLAAVPTSRPYPDLTGPLAGSGPWLTALLPPVGFLVLWRHEALWLQAPFVREVAFALLALGAFLAVLRAGTRRAWTASLRWLVTFDSLVAALLVALDVLPSHVTLLLWLGACGGRLVLLAGELFGAVIRRGHRLTQLWRAAGWVAGATLAWPLLATLAYSRGRFRPVEYAVLALPVLLAALLSRRRVVQAPERRSVPRHDPVRALGYAGALSTLLAGPGALLLAWWQGWETSWPAAFAGAAPALLALLPPLASPSPDDEPLASAPAWARETAASTFRAVAAFERQLAGAVAALLRALGAPARDLHAGDAQEYLLFLVGVCLLALVVPLLR